MTEAFDLALGTALAAVGSPPEHAGRLEIDGARAAAPPRLPVEDVGVACIGAALLAAARLHEARTGEWLAPRLDRAQARAALVSERLFRVAGDPAPAAFAPMSRFWRAADGGVRTHANYPWHREALLTALGVDGDGATEEDVAAAIATLPAEEVEKLVFGAGGVAAAVRSVAAWRDHPQGAAIAAEPLVAAVRLGTAEPRSAVGIRVLDFTRVIAGPVCSRFLGVLGADVLRIDSPELPDFEPGQAADTLLGKRSAFLDLRAAGAGPRGEDARARLEALLAEAHVVLLGYRPGALDRFGLSPEALAARHPGLVIMELSAWGHGGPWRERRGFDSIVQAASGIAAVEADSDGAPGALPCQLLDHGTGYLAAAAVLAALVEQREGGGTHLRRLSLARTAHWLLEAGDREMAEGGDRPPWQDDGVAFVRAVDGDACLAAVPPPGSLDGVPLGWRGPAARYGTADPAWRAVVSRRRSPR